MPSLLQCQLPRFHLRKCRRQDNWTSIQRPVAVAQKQTKGIVGLVCHDQVPSLVAVEIRRVNLDRIGPRIRVATWLKRPSTIPKQDIYRLLCGVIQRRGVLKAVGVEVADDDIE